MMQASNMECMVSHGGEIPGRRSGKRRRDASTADGGEGDTDRGSRHRGAQALRYQRTYDMGKGSSVHGMHGGHVSCGLLARRRRRSGKTKSDRQGTSVTHGPVVALPRRRQSP